MKRLIGWFGEKKTAFNLWMRLDARVYRRFHDVIVPGRNGTTQIDHLLVSPFGIFIVETKNLKGWIFGSEKQSEWTQTLYRKKYKFQNPLRQTFRQKKVLAQFLRIDESTVQTVVYFAGDCKLKTELPVNVMKSGLSAYIRQFRKPVLGPEELSRINETLEQHVTASPLNRRDHLRSLRERHASTTVCPKCGSGLVTRTAKKRQAAGSTFLGCTAYPKCRFTKSAS